MKKFLLVLFPLFLAASSLASPMRLDASFSALPENHNPDSFQGSYPFAGSLTFFYDSDSIPTTGGYNLDWVNPSSITFTAPHVGSKVFDETNTRLSVFFLDAQPLTLQLGDDLNPSSVSVGGYDDFFVLINPGSPYIHSLAFYSLASDYWFFGSDNNITATFAISPVAVPDTGSSALLFAVGLAAILAIRKRLSK